MRTGISMIELVISIVVMGIVVSALPMLLSQTQENNMAAMRQEVIMATKSRLTGIMTYQWDINSVDTLISPYERVLNTSASPDADNIFDTATLRRAGHINAPFRRMIHPTRTPTMPNSAQWGNNAFLDIDDFNNTTDSINITPQDFDFILDVNLTSRVAYISDTLNINTVNQTATFDLNISDIKTNPTNIKLVQVDATNTNAFNPINITLRSFAQNIGESTTLPPRQSL